MPTTKPRHAITETDRVAAALDAAARRWPADRDRPSRLLQRLIEAGHEAIRDDLDDRAEQRRHRVHAVSGALTGAYRPGYLDALRNEWER